MSGKLYFFSLLLSVLVTGHGILFFSPEFQTSQVIQKVVIFCMIFQLGSRNSPQPLKYQISFFADLLIIIIVSPNSYKGRTKEDCLFKKNNKLVYVVVYKMLASSSCRFK